MNRWASFALVALMLNLSLAVAQPVWAAGKVAPAARKSTPTAAPAQSTTKKKKVQNEDIAVVAHKAEFISQGAGEVVGTAVSPLFGMSVIGVVKYAKTPDDLKNQLAWYYQPYWWGPLIVILLLVACKDSIGPVAPPIKKLLDAAEALENKLSALIAAPIVLSLLVEQYADILGFEIHQALAGASNVAYAADGIVGAAQQGTFALGALVIWTAGLIVFFTVWLASHTINVLVLINPIPIIDVLLKAFRMAIVGLIYFAVQVHPLAGLLVCLLIIGASYYISGWAMRLMIFGSVYSYDLLLLRSWRGAGLDGPVRAFTAGAMTNLPIRTFGTLDTDEQGRLTFTYRPWFVGAPKTILVKEDAVAAAPAETSDAQAAPAQPAAHTPAFEVGRGLINPYVIEPQREEAYTVYFRLPPRYGAHEDRVQEKLRLDRTRDIRLGRSLRRAWKWLKEQFGGTRTQPAPQAG